MSAVGLFCRPHNGCQLRELNASKGSASRHPNRLEPVVAPPSVLGHGVALAIVVLVLGRGQAHHHRLGVKQDADAHLTPADVHGQQRVASFAVEVHRGGAPPPSALSVVHHRPRAGMVATVEDGHHHAVAAPNAGQCRA